MKSSIAPYGFNGEDDIISSPPDVELTNNSGDEFHIPQNEEEKAH